LAAVTEKHESKQGDLFESRYFVLQVVNVATWKRLAKDLINDGPEVVKGTDRGKRRTFAVETVDGSHEHSRSDGIERNLALKEISGELAIRTTESAGGMREVSVEMADSANVGLLGHGFFFRRAAISISLSRTR
jgi:hypothetical protein